MKDVSCDYNFFTQFDLSLKPLPRQGWKIHISCYYDNYQDILNIVSDYCFRNKITFKYINNTNILFLFLRNLLIDLVLVNTLQFIQMMKKASNTYWNLYMMN